MKPCDDVETMTRNFFTCYMSVYHLTGFYADVIDCRPHKELIDLCDKFMEGSVDKRAYQRVNKKVTAGRALVKAQLRTITEKRDLPLKKDQLQFFYQALNSPPFLITVIGDCAHAPSVSLREKQDRVDLWQSIIMHRPRFGADGHKTATLGD